MFCGHGLSVRLFGCLLASLILVCAAPAGATLTFQAAQFVQADGVNIDVPGYSVPTMGDWNGDGLLDLIVGQGDGTNTPRVRVYVNSGTPAAPAFSTFSYAQSNGSTLTVTGGGCLGIFPRMVDWNNDSRDDLLGGTYDGQIKLFTNTGAAGAPTFDAGAMLQSGPAGGKVTVDVGNRATMDLVDWDNDGDLDLFTGAYDGKFRIYLNGGGSDAPMSLLSTLTVQTDGADLLVPSGRSSPIIHDFDGDGRKDILTGNTDGQMLFYGNIGTDALPSFSAYSAVLADGVAIDLPDAARSRPALVDWTGDGVADLLVGGGDGLLRLYQGVPEPATLALLAAGAAAMLRRRK